ncbi:MAG TPA: hypothetical protein VGM10_31465 [Actinocrinis sp.]
MTRTTFACSTSRIPDRTGISEEPAKPRERSSAQTVTSQATACAGPTAPSTQATDARVRGVGGAVAAGSVPVVAAAVCRWS